MRLLIPALAVVALAGCTAAPQPMPVPTQTPSPSGTPAALLPLPGTDFLMDQVESFADDAGIPTHRFPAAAVAGDSVIVGFALTEGTWILRVSCATDASADVRVTLTFADGRDDVAYDAYCGETPPTGIVTATTQSPEFSGGGDVTMRLESDARFVAAAGLVQAG